MCAICRSRSPRNCRCCPRPTIPRIEFEKTSLDPPLGSGPYKIGSHKAGTFVAYERRPDYWAKDLPVNRGRFNFDEVRYEYYRDRTLELESLKAGAIDFREEFTSRHWATGYDTPAVKDGRLVRTTIPDERPSGAQGFFINTRRAKFQDKRVREALGLAFDFEWSNRNLFFGLYTRTSSFFENSDMMAVGRAVARGAGAAGALPRQAAARGFCRTVRAAGHRRIGH